MKTKNLLVWLILSLILFACNESNPLVEPEDIITTYKKEMISGFVQKGPFINGTSITISELDSNLVQTGRNFSTQIINNQGHFEIKGIELNSPFIEIKADGFYFNEVSGTVSNERLTLNALANVSDQNTVNVNILSTLEKFRLLTLVEQGKKFSEAKKLAQSEVLALFEISKTDVVRSELLDIFQSGDDNAILLASSIILQGNRSVSQLSELIANIGLDIKGDGKLDNRSYGSELINHSKMMDLAKVRSNIQARYSTIGLDFVIPDFETLVRNFNDKTTFEYTNKLSYPDSGKYGRNVLAINNNEMLSTNTEYSLRALIPTGHKIRVVFKNTSTNSHAMLIRYSIDEVLGSWNVTAPNSLAKIEWVSNEKDNDADHKIIFYGNGSGVFEFYEDGSGVPVKTTAFTWGITSEIQFVYPANGLYGPNILAMNDGTVLDRNVNYSIAAQLPPISAFLYRVAIKQSKGSGSYQYSSASGWSANYTSDKKMLILQTTEGAIHGDALILFNGEGEITVDVMLSDQPELLMKKTFTWK
jgi:hypothetical protein